MQSTTEFPNGPSKWLTIKIPSNNSGAWTADSYSEKNKEGVTFFIADRLQSLKEGEPDPAYSDNLFDVPAMCFTPTGA